MQTPTLSTNQIKTTLSAKKKRPKETLKNVLAVPYNNRFWPELELEDQEALSILLTTHLPKLKPEKVNIPWGTLKNVPKENRKEFTKKYIQENRQKENGNLESPQDQSVGITVGINTVSKLLEKNEAEAVLIGDVNPRLLVQHVLDQTVLYKVPVVCINNLKTVTKSATGIATQCMAFKRNIPINSTLTLIIESIKTLFKKIPSPESHINYNRSIDSFNSIESSEKKEEVKKQVVKIDEVEIRKNIYLKRKNPQCRAFVPEEDQKVSKLSKMIVDEFLPFTEDASVKDTVVDSRMKPTYKYKSLIVKRLKGDKDRNRKKIQKLK